MGVLRWLAMVVVAASGVLPQPALASSSVADHVLVVVNAANQGSVRIGEYYVAKRGVPPEQLLRLTGLPADPPDGIDRAEFSRTIQAPVAEWLSRHQAQDRILFIVLTKGVPLRINGAKDNSGASVDSELSVLYRRMTAVQVPPSGPLPNPYFLGDKPLADARPFTRADYDLYLVTRLDGFTVDDVIGLIDRALAPSHNGRFILDGRASMTDKGNLWLKAAADRLRAAGLAEDRVLFNQGLEVVTDQVDVLGYYSWGSNDPAITRRQFNLSFRPGAIGGMFVSTDGRTFREPPKDWKLPGWTNKDAWFAGSPQSLAGDLVRSGITGVSGHVAEPLLGHTIRPDILFPAYLAGFSLAEAYYLSMPSVSWMTVVVGDPLCAPFSRDTPSIEDVAIDPATELPAFFSRRRLAAIPASDLPLEAQQLVLRAESRTARNDAAGARADLERATGLVPTLINAQLLLAAMHEAAKDYDAAIARYRTILEHSPDAAIALNNLAYALATRKGDLREALAMAERAHELVPQSGAILDTVGWIHFLAGDVGRATPLLVEAVKREPAVAEIRVHLARVYATAGNAAAAREQALKAVELDRTLESRTELQAILSPK